MKTQVKFFNTQITQITVAFMLCFASILSGNAQTIELLAHFELNGHIETPTVTANHVNPHGSGVYVSFAQSGTILAEGTISYDMTNGYGSSGVLSTPGGTTVSESFTVPFTVEVGKNQALSVELRTYGEALKKFVFTDAFGDTGSTGLTLTKITMNDAAETELSQLPTPLTAEFTNFGKSKTTVTHLNSRGTPTSSSLYANGVNSADLNTFVGEGAHAAVNIVSPTGGTSGFINFQAGNMPHHVTIMMAQSVYQNKYGNFIVK